MLIIFKSCNLFWYMVVSITFNMFYPELREPICQEHEWGRVWIQWAKQTEQIWLYRDIQKTSMILANQNQSSINICQLIFKVTLTNQVKYTNIPVELSSCMTQFLHFLLQLRPDLCKASWVERL